MNTLIFILFVTCVVVQLLYWVLIFFRLRPNTKGMEEQKTQKHAISVCYKNEAKKLASLLPLLTKQKAAEIVLADDYSTDNSNDTVKAFGDSRIKMVKVQIDKPGKKAALYEALSSASSEAIVMTDADCKPATVEWSSIMTSKLSEYDAVLGYGPLRKTDGLLNIFARYETYLTGIQYLSYAQVGFPYMGVGRNLAVRRSVALPLLEKLKEDDIASGDDDLLVQGIDRLHGRVGICVDRDAFVFSESCNSISDYVRQKSRHMSTSSSYSLKFQMALTLFGGTHILLFLLLVWIVMSMPELRTVTIAIFASKWLIQLVINKKLMAMLDEKDLLKIFPLLDIATFVYYVVMTPYLMLKNRSDWN